MFYFIFLEKSVDALCAWGFKYKDSKIKIELHSRASQVECKAAFWGSPHCGLMVHAVYSFCR